MPNVHSESLRVAKDDVQSLNGVAVCDECGEVRLRRQLWAREWLPIGAGRLGLGEIAPGEWHRSNVAKRMVKGVCRQCRAPQKPVPYTPDGYDPEWITSAAGQKSKAVNDAAESRALSDIADTEPDDSSALLEEFRRGEHCIVCMQLTLPEYLIEGCCRACKAPAIGEGFPMLVTPQPINWDPMQGPSAWELLRARRSTRQLDANLSDLLRRLHE
jgi:hypothetical protein